MKKLVFIFIFCVLPFTFVNAQAPTGVDGIDITITPPNPAPGSNVDITVRDYLSDISAANITWSVNGKGVTSGIGKNDISITAPDLGKQDVVSITIGEQGGNNVQKSVTVKSGSVDMIWESGGYAPPLYGGKQDFVYQNTVRVIAMPHLGDASGVEIDPATLVYAWKQDSTNLQDQSGYGKQSITITGGIVPRATSIYVTVSTRDGSETASGVITLHPGSPSISFYKDDPLYGVLYNAALGSQTSFSNQEITLLAVPFSFNIPSLLKNNLQYNWTINGAAQPSLTTNRSVTLRVQDTSNNADYPVQLQLQNMKDILEGAVNTISVFFTANKNNNAITL